MYYFREGFCWSAVNGTRSTNELKLRIKQKSVTDVQGMSLHSKNSLATSKYIICVGNSDFMSRYTESFVNSTVIFQINDARQIPIIIPSQRQLIEFEKLFDDASIIKNQKGNDVSRSEMVNQLNTIQIKLNQMILKLYQII